MAPAAVTVTAPSRLHFGLLSFGHDRAQGGDAAPKTSGVRQFGGVGLMIDAPRWRLHAEPAPCWTVAGPQAERVAEFAKQFCRAVGLAGLPSWRLTVESAPPAHCGLGSGTQLGLAVAAALEAALELPAADIAELARRVGRGRRSAVGIHGFLRGGLLVEAGKLRHDEISPLVARVAVPQTWRVVLLRPREEQGLSGAAERAAFESLPPVPAVVTAQLCDVVLRSLLPAAREGDFTEFGRALHRYGRLAGSCFAAMQAGREFASVGVAGLVDRLRKLGAEGVGQSSWGPTVFALCASAADAQQLADAVGNDDIVGTIAGPCNRGAQIQIVRSSAASAHPPLPAS